MGINQFKRMRELELGKQFLALYKTGRYSYRRLRNEWNAQNPNDKLSHEKIGQLIKFAIIEEDKEKGLTNSDS